MSEVVNGNGHQMTATAPSGQVHANGNGSSSFDGVNEKAHQAPMYHGGGQGNYLSRTLTPGGHLADNDLLAIANSHRKIGNPLPLGGKFQSIQPDLALLP